jgi:hypothetical protein
MHGARAMKWTRVDTGAMLLAALPIIVWGLLAGIGYLTSHPICIWPWGM